MSQELRLASLDRDRWQLESGVLRHRESPEMFWIPEEIDRESVATGDLVKLIFEYDLEATGEDPHTGERMWVEVIERIDQFYIGALDNEPIVAQERHGLAPGSRIVFFPEHVIDIY